MAAYQAREKLQDERTGFTYNSLPHERVAPRLSEIAEAEPQRSGVAAASAYIERSGGYDQGRKAALFVGLYAPREAPDWCRGRENIEQFWNRAELAERQQNAQIAERIIIALPHELSLQQNIWLLQDHVKEFTRQGRVVQVAIHEPEHSGPGAERNIHAHLLVSMRGVDEHGFKASKAQEQQLRYLHRREYVTNLREKWADATNRHLARHGHEARIDHRTLAEQGIDREPTIHLGPGDSRRERQAERSAAGEINREIAAKNAERQALDRVVQRREAREDRPFEVAEPRHHAAAERAPELDDPDAWRCELEEMEPAPAPQSPEPPAQEVPQAPDLPPPEDIASHDRQPGRERRRERGLFGRLGEALRQAGEAALDWVAPRVAMPEPPAQEDAQARDAERRQKEEKAQADYDLMLRMYTAMNAAHDRAREGDRLHDRYQAERKAAWTERAAAETDVRIRHIAQDREQRVGHARQFADLKNSRLRGPERRQAAQKIVEQVRADRAAAYGVLQQKLAEVRHAYPVPKWGEWLAREEAAGDKKAGRALERHKAREAERGYTEETIPLYQDYEAERERAHLKQEAALKAVDERFSGIAAERQRFWDGRFAEERARALPGELKHDAIISVRIAQRRDRVAQREQWKRARQEARDQNPVLNWDQYLEREAARGDQDAKRALEARQRRREARTQEREDDELEH